jgi:hypothetical protein
MILGLQFIAIIFSFLMIYLALLNKKRNEIDTSEFISWVVIWSLTIFVVIFPELLRSFAQRFFITRLFDLMVVGGFVLVIAMVTRAYLGVKRMEKKLENLIRKEALKNVKEKKK